MLMYLYEALKEIAFLTFGLSPKPQTLILNPKLRTQTALKVLETKRSLPRTDS